MFKNLLSLACMNKKEKKRLAIAAGSSPGSSSSKKNNSSRENGLDDTLDKSCAIPAAGDCPSVLNTSQFLAGVVGDVSFNTANLQNRETPIDFGTREVKDDGDVLSVASRRPSSTAITPSPIPEENEENYSIDQFETPAQRDRVLAAFQGKSRTPRIGKPRKLAKVYHSELSPSASSSTNDENSFRVDSIRVRASKSAAQQMLKRQGTPVLGGSLRPIRGRRGVMWDEDTKFYSLDRRSSDVRLRKRDSSRRDAVEAGFEPRDAVPRCHSTQSLRGDVQRGVKAYTNSQFQASDLSLNPNGRVLAACDSTSGSVAGAPTAVVNPANRHHHNHQHHSSYDQDHHLQHHQKHLHDVDRRRSLQTLTGATSLYQMTNGSSGGARSQFSPSELSHHNHAMVHQNVGSRVRVSSVNQLCDSTSNVMQTPQFSIDQRRSVHNIGGPTVRNSFVEGIRTTSTPKNQIAVAPLAHHHKSRHVSESRDDEMRSERRGSGNLLPAYNNYMVRHSGEERLVDGPIDSASDGRIAYLEKRIRELEMSQQKEHNHSLQSTPSQSRYSNKSSSHLNGSSSMSTSEQLRLQELSDELVTKDRKVTSLESKLLKAYQRIEKINEEYDGKLKTLMFDGEHARDNLTRCVSKIQQLENELEVTRASAAAHNVGEHQEEYHELRDKIWKQERELQETRTMLTRLREKEAEYERMRSEKGYLELKNENLNKKLEAKKRAVEELERSVSTMRLEQTICQQSCSSGSTPLADEMETMSDIRPSLARPYAKAHSTMGSHMMSPLSHSKSTGLTKSVSSFGLNSTKRGADDNITPMMSRTIREQNRHLTDCRAMVVVLKDTIERLARGDNVDAAALLGVKMNMLSESEMDDDENEDYEAAESKPFSMMAAETALSKQCSKMVELDKDLDWIRLKLADWHGQTNMEGEGDRDACRVQ